MNEEEMGLLNTVRVLMRDVRKEHFARNDTRPNPKIPVIYYEETRVDDQPYDVPLVILRTRPCRWFEAGGCVMCNYELLAIDEGVSNIDLLEQLNFAIETLEPLSEFLYVFLTSQGSFLDDHEVSREMRAIIARELRKAGIRALATESEAKFCIEPGKINELLDELQSPLSIGIGYEAHSDFVRNVIINKGLPRKTFEKAVESISKAGARFYTYVTLGKPFMTVNEDIEDAKTAIKYSIDSGAHMVVLQLINIQPYTLTHRLQIDGKYKPPSIWSAIRLLEELPRDYAKKVSLKGIEADIEPVPLMLPDSCPVCRPNLVNVVNEWNYTRNMNVINSAIDSCSCFDEWLMARNSVIETSLFERTSEILDELSKKRIVPSVLQPNQTRGRMNDD